MPAPVVTVRGEAQLEGPPDLATLMFTAHRSGNSAEKVSAQLADASSQLREVVERHTRALEKHSTSGLHVNPVFRPGAATKVQGFRGTFSAELVLADLTALSTVVLALASLPGSQVDGPYWSLRRDNALYRQVRLAAIEDARLRAADYAAAFGSTVAELLEVSDLEPGYGGIRARMQPQAFAAMGPQDPPEFDFEPAVQTVAGQVTVRFTLTVPDLGTGSLG
jgi:uncharacterized protein YggE